MCTAMITVSFWSVGLVLEKFIAYVCVDKVGDWMGRWKAVKVIQLESSENWQFVMQLLESWTLPLVKEMPLALQLVIVTASTWTSLTLHWVAAAHGTCCTGYTDETICLPWYSKSKTSFQQTKQAFLHHSISLDAARDNMVCALDDNHIWLQESSWMKELAIMTFTWHFGTWSLEQQHNQHDIICIWQQQGSTWIGSIQVDTTKGLNHVEKFAFRDHGCYQTRTVIIR